MAYYRIVRQNGEKIICSLACSLACLCYAGLSSKQLTENETMNNVTSCVCLRDDCEYCKLTDLDLIGRVAFDDVANRVCTIIAVSGKRATILYKNGAEKNVALARLTY